MAVLRALSLASTVLLLFGRTTAQEGPGTLPESFIPVVDWGNKKVETYSSVSTLNRAADQDTTKITTTPPRTPLPTTTTTTSKSASASPPPGSQPTPPPSGTSSSGSSTNTRFPSRSPYTPSSSGSYTWNPATLPPFPSANTDSPPDVLLQVPTIAVKRIELDVDDIKADINLNAQVANLVSINAGIHASIQKVNLTISDVGAELELVVRLGHLADIVNRVFESLDLNPLLITTINNVTNILDNVIGQVDGLLGSITRGGTVLNFLIDNLGNIVQQVVSEAGETVNSIVGDYSKNMTYTGKSQMLPNGLQQKTYKYGPLNSLVNIVFNAAGQLVSAVVAKQDNGGGQPPVEPGTHTPPKQPQQQPNQPPPKQPTASASTPAQAKTPAPTAVPQPPVAAQGTAKVIGGKR